MKSDTIFLDKLCEIPRVRIEEAFGALLQRRMQKPTFFIMPVIQGDPVSEKKYQQIREALQHFQHKGFNIPLVELSLRADDIVLGFDVSSRYMVFRCLALDVGASEKIRDKIKQVLWPVWSSSSGLSEPKAKNVTEIKFHLKELIEFLGLMQDDKESSYHMIERRELHLASDGFFVSSSVAKENEIRTHSFDHGGGHFYRYRAALKRLNYIPPKFDSLSRYLNSLFTDCPNHFFGSEPRISAVRWPLQPIHKKSLDHELSRMAKNALDTPKYKGSHDNVEVHLLNNDIHTIAVEVPVWIESGELKSFSNLFSNAECLTGHIDILRLSDNKIEIWDYKSDAAQSVEAGLQVLLYAIILSVRTNISLREFVCGYFDVKEAYYFDPSNTIISALE